MQIDRSKFLLLTASIAGSACSSNSSTTSGGPVVVASPVIALAGPESTPSSSVATSGKPGQTTTNAADEETLAAVERAPVGSVDDGSLCDEGGPAPSGCATLRAPGPQCESFSDTKSMCNKLARGLRPRIAEKAVDCIMSKSGKHSVCDFSLASQCGMAAVQAGCVEPSTQSTCQGLVRTCGGSLNLRECQSLLSSVASKNRRRMISCMTEDCSTDYCMYQID